MSSLDIACMCVMRAFRFTPLDELATTLKSSAGQSSDGHQPKNVKLQKGDYITLV